MRRSEVRPAILSDFLNQYLSGLVRFLRSITEVIHACPVLPIFIHTTAKLHAPIDVFVADVRHVWSNGAGQF